MVHLPGSAQSLAGEFASLTVAGESVPTALDCRQQVNCSGDDGEDRHYLWAIIYLTTTITQIAL